ncbi:hypothetical protein TBLA_0A04650 [Henningerozyma blattae CBS 6284]|uniref:Nucleoside transporter FUN26 n=1 Tax=Henningerozyma blattae (strain ATCC 34711 / CBS 6284 / DSM 70876 / NBRC 10599 / NRRL Y-10934 / UCD 77-7) TaxID=1071380 RepID=I2GVV7_HENB6|nr:hypothetical protein TBLA_0A04650 [Tetrapisispora blattae CBS 6284]CCH58259.1 hypothetical protein TBLA_0A04650 [Tetrapisispora blattae CBS 6284]
MTEDYPLQAHTVETQPNSKLENASFYEKLQNKTYLTFFTIGIGLLWPWNCILSASTYFINVIFSVNTIWARNFTSSMMTVSTIASLIFNTWLAQRQFNYSQRVISGLFWEIIIFILFTLISVVHSSLNMAVVFFFVMILVIGSALGTALSQNGILAIANLYGSEYSQAVVVGQAIAGVAPSVVLFMAAFFGDDNHDIGLFGIICYLLATAMVCTVCIILFKKNSIADKLLSNETSVSSERTNVPFDTLYYKLKWLVLAILFTFIITMAFPVFASTTMSMGINLSDTKYSALAFIIWNIGDVYGRIIADKPMFRSSSFTALKSFIYSLSRIILVPLFFIFTTLNSRHKHSSLIFADICYMLLQFIFGVTNGHIISIAFMKVPEYLETDEEKEAAGGFTTIFVFIGLALGSLLSYLVTFTVNSILSNNSQS